jgi:4-amino-4-deoxychorismate lyase
VGQVRVVALLGAGVVPAGTPILRADDLGVLRGDGVFETMHVRGGRPWLVDPHLDRMARSAARLDLALPARAALAGLIDQACAAWEDDREATVRLVCTRGPEGGGEPSVFATVSPVPAASVQARRNGIAVVTASLGFAVDSRTDAPWLLGGVKSVSYAVNMASQRWAVRSGADDVLWVSSDGYALEGPTSTLVWLDGDVLRTVPVEQTGVLAGTTARWLLDHADELGYRAAERLVRPAELRGVDGVWFASSGRGLVEIRSLDGSPLPASAETGRMQKLLGFPVDAG